MSLIHLSQIKDGLNLKQTIDGVAGKALVVDKIVPTDNQTEFLLSEIPSPMVIEMLVNNVTYLEDDGYFTVDREAQLLTWVFTDAEGGFDIRSDFGVNIKFQIDSNDALKTVAQMYKPDGTSDGGTGEGETGSFLLNS